MFNWETSWDDDISWNSNDTSFDRKRPCFGGLTFFFTNVNVIFVIFFTKINKWHLHQSEKSRAILTYPKKQLFFAGSFWFSYDSPLLVTTAAWSDLLRFRVGVQSQFLETTTLVQATTVERSVKTAAISLAFWNIPVLCQADSCWLWNIDSKGNEQLDFFRSPHRW